MLSLSLSRTTGYAIQALCGLCTSEDRHIMAQEIADQTGIPKPYLSKIMHALGRSGLIATKRGYRGGFVLTAPPDEITLMQIIEAVEGPRWQARCLLGKDECSDERACPTHAFWKTERARIEEKLRSMTLAEVAAFERSAAARRKAAKPRRRSRS